MYAVIKTGGKQYKVAVGEKVKVEQIAADVGQEVVIDQVLAVGDGAELKVGTPVISGATVKATVVSHGLHHEGPHLQDAPPQALPTPRRPSPVVHRAANRLGERLSRRTRNHSHGTEKGWWLDPKRP